MIKNKQRIKVPIGISPQLFPNHNIQVIQVDLRQHIQGQDLKIEEFFELRGFEYSQTLSILPIVATEVKSKSSYIGMWKLIAMRDKDSGIMVDSEWNIFEILYHKDPNPENFPSGYYSIQRHKMNDLCSPKMVEFSSSGRYNSMVYNKLTDTFILENEKFSCLHQID